ncbi:Sec23 domain-containing protein [Ordospora colligata]|nr:Sec23 domain-containing protein [Ordospora colligata]
MNLRDSMSEATQQTSSPFPRAFEERKKQKMKIPDLPHELEKDQAAFVSFDTMTQPPPLSTTNCFISETNNTDPNLVRSTMYVLPKNSDTFDLMEIPLGIVVNPFCRKAMPTELDKSKAVRCMECQSYVNAFSVVEANFFYCNICNTKNCLKERICEEITRYSTIEYVEKEVVKDNRVIDCGGIVSEGLFRTKTVCGPAFLIGIDSTSPMLVEHSLNGIKRLIDDENFRFLFRKVGIILLSDRISLLKASKGTVVEVKLSDKQHLPFISPEFLMDVQDEQLMINVMEYLKSIPNNGASKKGGISDCLSIAISMAGYCRGSKMALFTNSQEKIDSEMIVKQFIEIGCSLNVFCTEKTQLAQVCISSTGRTYLYVPETLAKLEDDLIGLGSMKSSYKVSVETKTSDSLRKLMFYGNTKFEHLGFQEFSQMDDSTTFAQTFTLSESLQSIHRVYAQVVVSFYGFDGSRRVLVLNTSFGVSSKISDVYANLSFDTLACIYAKYMAMDADGFKTNSKKVEEIMSKSLKFYRSSCCKEASSSQFVLPESIKLIPLMYQSMLKNRYFLNEKNAENMAMITGFTVEQNLRFFYPRMFTFTDFYMDNSLEKVKGLRLTSESLSSEEIYVLDNSQKLYVYIGKEVDTTLKKAIFTEGTEESGVLHKMIDEFYSHYDCELPVIFIEEGKGGVEIEFIGYLTEDKMNNIVSYPDYICELHFKVKNA